MSASEIMVEFVPTSSGPLRDSFRIVGSAPAAVTTSTGLTGFASFISGKVIDENGGLRDPAKIAILVLIILLIVVILIIVAKSGKKNRNRR